MNIKKILASLIIIVLISSFTTVKSKKIVNENKKNFLENNNLSISNLETHPDSISWNLIKPGSTISGNFTVENINQNNLEISWVVLAPDWGMWTFSPDEKTNHKSEDGEIKVDFDVIVPKQNNTDFFGKISIINIDNVNDCCSLSVSISTKKIKNSNNFLLINLLNNFSILDNLKLKRGK